MANSKRYLINNDEQIKPNGEVGLAKLPEQIVNKSINRGWDFNILCIGETGIGKSTLIDTLFKTEFDSSPVEHNQARVSLNEHTYCIKESNVQLRLKIVDTVGFGDQVNKEHTFLPIVDYVNAQFEMYLQEELKPDRKKTDFHDTRIHVCLYFISPTGHSLKSLDLVTMKALDEKVNLIPIIAKSDTICPQELLGFKSRIQDELKRHDIKLYSPNGNELLGSSDIPFSVIGSRDMVNVKNSKVRGRRYPWGIVEVENDKHCDFVRLREMLIRVNMEDLCDKTHNIHYEIYRANNLKSNSNYTPYESIRLVKPNNPNTIEDNSESVYQDQLEAIKTASLAKFQAKEMEIKQREAKLHEEFELQKNKYLAEKQQLDIERKSLEREITDWKEVKKNVEESRNNTMNKLKGKKSNT